MGNLPCVLSAFDGHSACLVVSLPPMLSTEGRWIQTQTRFCSGRMQQSSNGFEDFQCCFWSRFHDPFSFNWPISQIIWIWLRLQRHRRGRFTHFRLHWERTPRGRKPHSRTERENWYFPSDPLLYDSIGSIQRLCHNTNKSGDGWAHSAWHVLIPNPNAEQNWELQVSHPDVKGSWHTVCLWFMLHLLFRFCYCR